LPEHFRFHDCLRGRELLRMHGRLHGLRGPRLEARIDELLERVRLTEAADRPIRTYSKGMLQRAGLAQALINSPELVFLDEPTSGLDPLGRVLVRNIIEELRAAGTTVFLNSHLLGEVEATCDRVVFVKRGRVVHELTLAGGGEPSATLDVELRLDRTDPLVLEGIARFGRDVHADGASASGADLQRVVRLSVESERVLPDLARWLVEAGVGIYELRSRRKSLEQWFLEVMGADQAPG
jgi:ABC-2 type transport system ATP-binding protein